MTTTTPVTTTSTREVDCESLSGYVSRLAAAAAGGSLPGSPRGLLAGYRLPTLPRRLTTAAVAEAGQLATVLAGMGPVGDPVRYLLLGWLLTGLDGEPDPVVARAANRVVCDLALGSASAAVTTGRPLAARQLWLLGLRAAAAAGDTTGRDRVLAAALGHLSSAGCDDVRLGQLAAMVGEPAAAQDGGRW